MNVTERESYQFK